MCSNYMFLCDVETVFAKFSLAQAFHQVVQDLFVGSIHREPFYEELVGWSFLFCRLCLFCVLIIEEFYPLEIGTRAAFSSLPFLPCAFWGFFFV